jgi:hypothetical protein
MRRGQRRADRPENQRQPQGNKAGVQVCCRSASRRVRQWTDAVCPPRNILQREIVQTHILYSELYRNTQRLSLTFGSFAAALRTRTGIGM